MRAEILVPQAARRRLAADRLYSYRVPEALAPTLRVGHLVAIPFGERMSAGIVWALDASDELDDDVGAPTDGAPRLRAINRPLLPDPVISAAHHALAEWISDYYATPLADAARLMLPPGLLGGLRETLLPVDSPRANDAAGRLTSDAAMTLGLLRERGRLDREQVREALGAQRARAAISALLASGLATLETDVAGTQREQRRERLIRLTGAPEAVADWQRAARAKLDARIAQPPGPLASSALRRRATRGERGDERQSERVLRQLAVLDVLSRPGLPASWRLEELQRLTRARSA